jgi:hypothetical protein
MDFYKKIVIKILKRSISGSDSQLLKILERGEELTQQERRELEELMEQII